MESIDRPVWMRAGVVYGLFAAFFAAAAAIEMERFAVPWPVAGGVYFCLLGLLAIFLAPAFPQFRRLLRSRFASLSGAAVSIGLLLAPYGVYAAGSGDFRWEAAGRLAAIAAGPFLVFGAFPVRERAKLNWQDALALAWAATPILARWIGGLWNEPINLDFMARLYVVSVGAWAFLILRGTDGVGYEARFSGSIARAAAVNFGLFAVIGIPLGLALGFIGWNPDWPGLWGFFFDCVTLFVFIAIPEELFFRGLLQNLLEGSWGSRWGAQAVAAVLFGLMHILHGFPNWPYVLMASIAGWFYGSAWRSSRSLVAAGITHALVDAIWRAFFEA